MGSTQHFSQRTTTHQGYPQDTHGFNTRLLTGDHNTPGLPSGHKWVQHKTSHRGPQHTRATLRTQMGSTQDFSKGTTTHQGYPQDTNGLNTRLLTEDHNTPGLPSGHKWVKHKTSHRGPQHTRDTLRTQMGSTQDYSQRTTTHQGYPHDTNELNTRLLTEDHNTPGIPSGHKWVQHKTTHKGPQHTRVTLMTQMG